MKYGGSLLVISVIFNISLMAQELYFSTPRESVKLISEMLVNEEWEKLTRYYNPDDIDNDKLDSMRNGTFFIRQKRPDSAHPGGFWRYKEPFPVGFIYLSHNSVSPDRIKVNVYIEIDQGEGMLQQGTSFFYLTETDMGYQLIPKF